MALTSFNRCEFKGAVLLDTNFLCTDLDSDLSEAVIDFRSTTLGGPGCEHAYLR